MRRFTTGCHGVSLLLQTKEQKTLRQERYQGCQITRQQRTATEVSPIRGAHLGPTHPSQGKTAYSVHGGARVAFLGWARVAFRDLANVVGLDWANGSLPDYADFKLFGPWHERVRMRRQQTWCPYSFPPKQLISLNFWLAGIFYFYFISLLFS
jgi:hypothetical protein